MTALEAVCAGTGAYETPKGFYDVSYVYVRNYYLTSSSPLIESPLSSEFVTIPGGLSDAIALDGDSDFILRMVNTNLNYSGTLGTTYFNFQDKYQFNYFPRTQLNNPTALNSGLTPVISVVPEKEFPAGGALAYVLGPDAVSSLFLPFNATTIDPPFVAVMFVAFQGVKRYRGIADRAARYNYRERPFTICFTFNLDWLFLQTPYASLKQSPDHTFIINIDNFDFELLAISTTDTLVPFGYEVILYDANSVATSNDFVPLQYCLATGPGASNFTQGAGNCFPVPGLMYPAGGAIKLDVRSLCAAFDNGNTGGTQTIYFRGVQRIPCN